MTDELKLGKYKGYNILSTAIVVNKLGDGLSDAVAIEPVVPKMNESMFLGVRVRKTKERYDVVRDKNDSTKILGVVLVQIFDATGATFVDEGMVGKQVQSMVDRIAEEEEFRKNGQMSLEVPDEPVTKPKRGSRADKDRAKHGELADQVDDALRDVI